MNIPNIVGFPNVYNFSHLGEDSIMIMDLLGKNLETLMKETKAKKFTLKTVLMIADQLVRILFSYSLSIKLYS